MKPAQARPRSAMWPWSLDMIAHSEARPRTAKWADMGAGKTVAALTIFADAVERFDACRALVIAPLRVASKTWPDEIRDWAHLNHLRYVFMDGGEQKIRNMLQYELNRYDVWGLGCDSVHILARIFLGRPHPWDTVIVDESSRFKNPTSKRTKSLRLLTIHPHQTIIMSGTPMPQGAKDLWAQYYAIDRGQRLGATEAEYKRRFFVTQAGLPSKTANKTAMLRIMKAVRDITYVLRPEDIAKARADIGRSREPIYNQIMLALPPKIMAAYKEFQREYILETVEGDKITAINAAGLGMRLLQFSSGAVYGEPVEGETERKVVPLHDVKVEALKDIVEDNEGKPVLVAYNFKHEIPRILKALPKAEVFGKDPDQIDRWNRGEIPILLAHPKSAAHGLNLQYGGHILVWFSFDYNLENYLQMNKRLARPGQENVVMIHHLIVEGTVDEIAMAALQQKDKMQNWFQDELKKLIVEVLENEGEKV